MLLAVCLLLAILTVVYLQERSKEWQLYVEQCHHRLTLAEEIVARDLNRVRADLLFVAALPEVQNAINTRPESLRGATDVFQRFVASQESYFQVRLIDRQGKEVVRVDWDGSNSVVTPSENLQDKSDRYYVIQSLDLQVGQIFTSKFDLNLELGQIERPLKPVIRFVTPVTRNGEAGDLLVFNYHGSALLEELAEISLPGNTYLARDNGGFMLGPSPDTEWGWLLGHSNRFSTVFERASLSRILEAPAPMKTYDGIFLARKVQLEAGIMPSANRQTLYLLAHVPSAEAFRGARKLLYRLLLVGGIMLIPLATITRFWAAAIDRREWQNQRIAESEHRLRQLSAQLVRLQEEERRNLSREIHDSLGQQATAINLDLRMLKEKLSETTEIKRLIKESDELLKSLHGFATRVRPVELDDLGLQVALESHVTEFENRTGIECNLEFQIGSVQLDSTMEAHVFRIVQEALNNIEKHADASFALVELKRDEAKNELWLQVADDGIGIDGGSNSFESSPGTEKRLGMLGMQERIELLNGVIELDSTTDGHGTTLKVRVPLHNAKQIGDTK